MTITERFDHTNHRRWRSRRWWWRLSHWMCSMGIVANGSTTFQACCNQRWNGWRGSRRYILGRTREEWSCLIKRHHIATDAEKYGVHCGICLPCPDCGETVWHHDCPASMKEPA